MVLRNLLLRGAWLSYYTAARDLGLAGLTTLYDGLAAGIAQYALLEGMRRAEVSLLAPFEYSALVWGAC